MNQILSVELPKKRTDTRNGYSNKASIKSVVTFFCIFLIIFGIATIGISLFLMMGLNSNQDSPIPNDLPRIDVSQNATELEVEIACSSEILKIEHNWEDKEVETVEGNGRNGMTLNIDIPSGNNVFNITVTDVDGRKNTYSKEYVGAKEPNITVFDPNQKPNTIIIKCEEQSQLIKFISYNYDEEEEIVKNVNNKEGTIEVESRQGEHKLTIKVGYEDGTVGKLSKKVFTPTVDIYTNGVGHYTKFIINASDLREIVKVDISFNGEKKEEIVNDKTFQKEIDLKPGKPGSNELMVKVYNKDGMVYTKGARDKNRIN